jgi:hypothetical protein
MGRGSGCFDTAQRKVFSKNNMSMLLQPAWRLCRHADLNEMLEKKEGCLLIRINRIKTGFHDVSREYLFSKLPDEN